MLFGLNFDRGDRLMVYAVPDDFTSIPTARFLSGGREVYACDANVTRPELVEAGRHESGRCNFEIGVEHIPNLAEIDDLAVVEGRSGVLIYRRAFPGRIQKKVFRMETHLFPMWGFDQGLTNRFQFSEKGLDRFGFETASQMMVQNDIDSIYLSGRLQIQRYSFFMQDKFEFFTFLQSPHEEFAERLLVLSTMNEPRSQILGERDIGRLGPLIEYVKSLPLEDFPELRRGLSRMPRELEAHLIDPLLRQLTTTTPDEMPRQGAVATALEALAEFKMVGLQSDAEPARDFIADWLGLETSTLRLRPNFPSVGLLAAFLRESGAIDHLIERDLELYFFIEDAWRATSAAKAPPP